VIIIFFGRKNQEELPVQSTASTNIRNDEGKTKRHFAKIKHMLMCFSCKYLVDSRFNFFDELIDEIK
jgi:hypothetical protein